MAWWWFTTSTTAAGTSPIYTGDERVVVNNPKTTLKGLGSLSESNQVTFNSACTLTGVGKATTGDQRVVIDASATAAGIASATTSQQITVNAPTATAKGLGSATTSQQIQLNSACTLTGIGGLSTGDQRLILDASATAEGVAAIDTSQQIVFNSSATLSGKGSLSSVDHTIVFDDAATTAKGIGNLHFADDEKDGIVFDVSATGANIIYCEAGDYQFQQNKPAVGTDHTIPVITDVVLQFRTDIGDSTIVIDGLNKNLTGNGALDAAHDSFVFDATGTLTGEGGGPEPIYTGDQRITFSDQEATLKGTGNTASVDQRITFEASGALSAFGRLSSVDQRITFDSTGLTKGTGSLHTDDPRIVLDSTGTTSGFGSLHTDDPRIVFESDVSAGFAGLQIYATAGITFEAQVALPKGIGSISAVAGITFTDQTALPKGTGSLSSLDQRIVFETASTAEYAAVGIATADGITFDTSAALSAFGSLHAVAGIVLEAEEALPKGFGSISSLDQRIVFDTLSTFSPGTSVNTVAGICFGTQIAALIRDANYRRTISRRVILYLRDGDTIEVIRTRLSGSDPVESVQHGCGITFRGPIKNPSP